MHNIDKKTGLKLLLWPIFTHKYILVNKKVATVHHCHDFVNCIHPKLLTTKFVPIIMFQMLSELRPLGKVGADIVLEHGNINNFLNLF